jgi:hypothetical protein
MKDPGPSYERGRRGVATVVPSPGVGRDTVGGR